MSKKINLIAVLCFMLLVALCLITQSQESIDPSEVADLEKVELKQLQKAIKNKYGVDLGLDIASPPGRSVASIKDGKLMIDGSSVDLGKLSKGTKVLVGGLGDIIVHGETKPPSNGIYYLKMDKKTDVQLPNGKIVPLEGEIAMENGRPFLGQDRAKFYGWAMPNSMISNRKVSILFDSEQSTGDFVRFTPSYTELGGEWMYLQWQGGDYQTRNAEITKGQMRLTSSGGVGIIDVTYDGINSGFGFRPGRETYNMRDQQNGFLSISPGIKETDAEYIINLPRGPVEIKPGSIRFNGVELIHETLEPPDPLKEKHPPNLLPPLPYPQKR